MANLGNVGKTFAILKAYSSWSVFDNDQRPNSVDMTATSTTPGSVALLQRNGVQIDRQLADPITGVWHFYDMDNSGDYIYSITTSTPLGGPTGECWSATVISAVATVTQLFSSNRTRSFSYG